jgi:adenylate cyclase
MNARLERKLRALAVIIVAGTIAGLAVNLAQGRTSPSAMMVGTIYGLLLCVVIGGVELFVLDGLIRDWLSRLSFTVNLIVRSTIYAAIIMIIQGFHLGEVVAGLPADAFGQNFWSGFISAAVISVLMNLGFAIANIIGPRAFLNFRQRAVSFPHRGKSLCTVRRHRGIDRPRRAAWRDRHPPFSRPHVPFAYPCGRGLSR